MERLTGCQKRKMRAINLIIIIIVMLLFPLPSFAGGRRLPYNMNVGDGYLSTFYGQTGWQMVLYPYYVKGGSLWDARGEKVDIDIRSEGILVRPIYGIRVSQQTLWLINAVIPQGRLSIKNPSTNEWETSSGLGDVLLVPFSTFHKISEEKRLGIYVDMFIYLPFGEYEKGRIANLGTNQYSLEPQAYILKGWRLGSKELFTEIGVHYFYNGENRDEQFRPGDMGQIDANLGLIAGRLTMGFSARYAASVSEDEIYGNKVEDSKVKITEIGASVSYQISQKCNLYVRVMEGIDGENTAKTTMIMGKIWFPF